MVRQQRFHGRKKMLRSNRRSGHRCFDAAVAPVVAPKSGADGGIARPLTMAVPSIAYFHPIPSTIGDVQRLDRDSAPEGWPPTVFGLIPTEAGECVPKQYF